jgi:branched-chain amino acid transport system substrate-binding protein
LRSNNIIFFGKLFSFFALCAFLSVSAVNAKTKEIVLGALAPMSGPAAPWGVGMKNVLDMAVDDINNGGFWWGKKGITINGEKYELKLNIYDHAMDAGKAVSGANRLVHRDGAKFVLTLIDGMVKAHQPVTERAKVITVAYGSPAKSYINENNKFTWMYGIDAMAAAIFYPWLEKNRDIKRIAILDPDSLMGRGTAEASRFGISKTKMEIVYEEFFPEDTQDYYPILVKTLKTNPDFIDLGNTDPGARALILKQARELGYKGPMYLITPDIANLKKVAGWKSAEGLYFVPHDSELNAAQAQIQKEYIERYGEENWFGSFAFLFWDFTFWLAQAMEDTNSMDTEVINSHLEKMKLKSIFGSPAYMAGNGFYGINRIPMVPYNIAEVQNGEIVPVIRNAFTKYLE